MNKFLKRALSIISVLPLTMTLASSMGQVFTVRADDSGAMVFDATKLDETGISDKTVMPSGTTFTDSYFTAKGTLTYRTSTSTGKIIAIELGKAGTGTFEFTCGDDTDVVLGVSSTGGSNTSAVGLYTADGTLVANNEGATSVTGTGKTELTYTRLAAGTYFVQSPLDPDKNRGVRLISLSVADRSAGAREPRRIWKDVAAPVFTEAVINNGTITINFDMVIGYDGADNVTVEMVNGRGKTVSSLTCAIAGDAGSVTFTPSATDSYIFIINAIREGETKKKVITDSFSFTLPLANCDVISATSAGDGSATVEWNAVPEADSYDVYYRVSGTSSWTKASSFTGTTGTVTGLTIGTKYDYAAKAKRGAEYSDFGAYVSATVYEDARRGWAFSAFGTGTDTSKNFFEGSVNEGDGSVRICSLSSKGKLQPTSTDGLAFYYTTIDAATENFVLTGKIHVNSWTYTNGQDGFGLMACDTVGVNGDNSTFWNNSYMISGTKVTYNYDTELGEVASASGETTTNVQMKLGIGAQEKKGVTAYAISKGLVNTTDFIQNVFSSTMYPLETSGVIYGKGNIIGNYTNTEDIGSYKQITDVTFRLERNNTGFILTYIDEKGKESSKLYYDTDRENLTSIDEEHIYVGFFASRTFDITVSDVKLTTSNPETDAPAEARKITTYPVTIKGASASQVGVPEYTFIFSANANGTVTITHQNTKTVLADKVYVKANEFLEIPVTLEKNGNGIVMDFIPEEGYQPKGEYSALESYEKVNSIFYVTYKRIPGSVVYVSPDGNEGGNGTKEKPYDITTALVYAHAGQTIYLMGGTYKLQAPIKVGRGQSGTADSIISVIADPESTERPVLDFDKYYEGLSIGGDYWYLSGFDVCHTGNGKSGLEIRGSYNVVDGVNSYENGNTGIQITGSSKEPRAYWPHDNYILNCTSHDNADAGYEDADGFACKLTTGDNNVFEGCIAYCNADDGWDLYAKVETGSIGSVVIKNCIAYRNGFLSDGTVAGNGNGFKMGGSSLSGKHQLINSVAYENKAKGIDSNSCPDIIVTNCTSFNNKSYNVAFYTNDAANTDFVANGLISFRNDGSSTPDNFKLKGTQDESKVYAENNFYCPSGNSKALKPDSSWFKSLDTSVAPSRNADGSINVHDLLVLTDAAPANSGAVIVGTASRDNSKVQVNVPDPTPTPAPTATPTIAPTEAPQTSTNEAPVATNAPAGTTASENISETTEAKSFPAAAIIVIFIAVAALTVAICVRRKKK